jgi:hypothetical protein
LESTNIFSLLPYPLPLLRHRPAIKGIVHLVACTVQVLHTHRVRAARIGSVTVASTVGGKPAFLRPSLYCGGRD